MGQKTNPKIERVLALVEPGRRDALRKILATAAYAAPVVASFSLDAEASQVTCFVANQTCSGTTTFFSGTVKCKGLSLNSAPPPAVPQHVDMKLDVRVRLCEGPTDGSGFFRGGASSLLGPLPPLAVSFVAAIFPGKDKDTLGFAVIDCESYFETGQWTHDVKKDGTETLKGKSFVLINTPGETAYTLECEYDLKGPDVPG